MRTTSSFPNSEPLRNHRRRLSCGCFERHKDIGHSRLEVFEGRIRLQYQKYPIEFKNIKLKLVNH